MKEIQGKKDGFEGYTKQQKFYRTHKLMKKKLSTNILDCIYREYYKNEEMRH